MSEQRTPEPQPAVPVSTPEPLLPQGAEEPAETRPGVPARSSRPSRLTWSDRVEQLGRLQLYHTWHARARSAKIALHMFIGVLLVVVLLVQAIIAGLNWVGLKVLTPFGTLSPLSVLAYALFFAAGVELAYRLFTPGPDEVLDPLLLGVAGAILLGASTLHLASFQEGLALLLAVSALAGLFAMKKYLYQAEEEEA